MQLNNLPTELRPYASLWCDSWLMEKRAFDLLEAVVTQDTLREHMLNAPEAMSERSSVERIGSTAVVQINGVMMKARSSLASGVSTVELRRDLRQLMDDDTIERVLLKIESPGGTAAGTYELGAVVSALNERKPVIAYIEDIGASAAYWVASQAGKVYANSMAKVGSIGTYAVLQDMSKAAETAGVKVHVIRAGKFKGMGTPGTELTQEQIDEIQRLIDRTNDAFLAAVAVGRGMKPSTVQQLADGRVHPASDALSLGLIDGIKTWDETLGVVQSLSTLTRRDSMATAKEIETACPGILPERVVSYLKDEKTLADCVSDHMQELALNLFATQEQLKLLQNENEVLKQDLAAARTQPPGVEPLEETRAQETCATEEWERLVKQKTDAGMSKMQAVVAVSRENPGLRESMLEEVNNQ